MLEIAHRIYLRFRSPRIFLVAITAFIVVSLLLHYFRGYDADWGGTNLTLSTEASIASAVITVAAEETLRLLKAILKIVKEHERMLNTMLEMQVAQEKTLKGVLLIAEAQRDMLIDQAKLLRALKEWDEQILGALGEGEKA
ncbi:hypothetical protein C7410_115168 [Paraburkholderia silvatlantica]|uniref:Uncharacterized protein n=1 Tax=Paraburkholderia silvatlantica TaxID=321895 RepID=A0A2V4T710_9BURK|nr:hypothetical protein [Paraburkholderia silvatlantica]PYE21325.1 hypothetical protein C7410_115168 [Paraburkholderia silvatlantica]